MGNVAVDSFETYMANLKLILLFSIPFIISLLIPVFAAVPTYISAGGIFLRTASLFVSISPISIAVIIISLFISLLFVSFAFVAISIIVKSKRTYTKSPKYVIDAIEKYTGRVFLVLLIYTVAIMLANIIGYVLGIEAALTAFVAFVGFVVIFYAPTAIVIDDKRIIRAVKDSVKLMIESPGYFIIWLVLAIVIISVLDVITIGIAGTVVSRYLLLLINSLILLPYFVIFQTEAYMKKFPLLRH